MNAFNTSWRRTRSTSQSEHSARWLHASSNSCSQWSSTGTISCHRTIPRAQTQTMASKGCFIRLTGRSWMRSSRSRASTVTHCISPLRTWASWMAPRTSSGIVPSIQTPWTRGEALSSRQAFNSPWPANISHIITTRMRYSKRAPLQGNPTSNIRWLNLAQLDLRKSLPMRWTGFSNYLMRFPESRRDWVSKKPCMSCSSLPRGPRSMPRSPRSSYATKRIKTRSNGRTA